LSFSLALATAVSGRAVLAAWTSRSWAGSARHGRAGGALDDPGKAWAQILVFTGQREAADRLASLGAPVHDIHNLRQRERDQPAAAIASPTQQSTAVRPVISKKPKTIRRKVEGGKQPKARRVETPTDGPASTDRSDAA
jgi:hypothetical protein